MEWKNLDDGYRVKTKITIWGTEDVLEVPSSTLFRHDEGSAVFAVREKLVTLVPAELGRRNGLGEGDRVIVHPSDRVVDGAMVPRALGLNPSRTIAALAEYCAAQMD